jgi:hypothetical protein
VSVPDNSSGPTFYDTFVTENRNNTTDQFGGVSWTANSAAPLTIYAKASDVLKNAD